ncbi:uncharacterized protein LOC109835224 [Asparagus officinalis]|uniref:uncharacterized protein LOC109835224 n=1 Tax=Asparagus officinalis TaxID=4686 RepID=UPI00098E37E0|nr:uncharacterized protein LOC109835224 [Asparagus officinalis]
MGEGDGWTVISDQQRVWDLTGIPCPHAISAILFMRKNPEDFVAHWYKSEAYTNAYESLLNPVQGTRFWDLQQEGSMLPPHSIRKPIGRPKLARRRNPSEGPRNPFKASREGVQLRCTHCESSERTWRKCHTAPPRQ